MELHSPSTSASTMATPPSVQNPSVPASASSARAPRVLACVLCQQRKVKCDRKFPCGNCVKARVQCVSSTPAPPRRRKKRVPAGDDDLIKKVKKYETMLQKYGEKIDFGEGEMQGRDAHSPHGDPTPSDDGQMDHSQYQSDSDSGFPDIDGLVIDACPADTNLTAMHPSPVHIFRLWQTFIDNVNPVIKTSHAPTMQQAILEASASLSTVSRPMEALLFAMYSVSVNSLTNAECESMLGEKKMKILGKFHAANLRALQRAQFLRSEDMTVLHAFTLFLISARTYYDVRTQWVLSGILVRIAQGIGLHRDPELNGGGFTPFEVEMRRRLWWSIVLVDSRLAAASGGAFSILNGDFDTQVPLNVNDSELSPQMRETPIPRVGSTEMTFALARYEINNYLRTASNTAVFDGSWQKLGSPNIPTAIKDSTLDELANVLETKYVQYCDSSIPMHMMTIGLARTAVGKLRQAAHQPRKYANGFRDMPTEERDMLWKNSITTTEFDNIAQTSPQLSRFLWHVNNHFMLDAFVFMVSELRHRTSGPDVDRAWKLVTDVYQYHPEMASGTRINPVYAAIGNLVLKAWEEKHFRLGTFQQNPSAPIPAFIQKLFMQRAPPDISKAISEPRKGSSSSLGGDGPPDFINTGEYIKDLDDAADVAAGFIAQPEPMQQMMWDGTYVNMGIGTGGLGEMDWSAMNMPFDVNAGFDPMRVFDPLPVDTQPMDWEFWNGIMASGIDVGGQGSVFTTGM